MRCRFEQGHKGYCVEGEPLEKNPCRKTAVKWFAVEKLGGKAGLPPAVDPRNQDDNPHPDQELHVAADQVESLADWETPEGVSVLTTATADFLVDVEEIEGITPEELAGSSEQQLAMLYRRHVHPSTRQEATEWARDVVAARDLGGGV